MINILMKKRPKDLSSPLPQHPVLQQLKKCDGNFERIQEAIRDICRRLPGIAKDNQIEAMKRVYWTATYSQDVVILRNEFLTAALEAMSLIAISTPQAVEPFFRNMVGGLGASIKVPFEGSFDSSSGDRIVIAGTRRIHQRATGQSQPAVDFSLCRASQDKLFIIGQFHGSVDDIVGNATYRFGNQTSRSSSYATRVRQMAAVVNKPGIPTFQTVLEHWLALDHP